MLCLKLQQLGLSDCCGISAFTQTDKHNVQLLTLGEKPDKVNSQRSEVMMINKENLAQDRVKVLWFLKHT